MADKKVDPKKTKVSQTDKYYKIKADFSYLRAYNYKITKEIGRGGYGVVYKVILPLYSLGHQHCLQLRCLIRHQNQFQHCLPWTYLRRNGFLTPRQRPIKPTQISQFICSSRYHSYSLGIFQIQAFYCTFFLIQTFFNTFAIEDVKHYIFELLIGLKNLK